MRRRRDRVNWTPWSVLKILGEPWRSNASCKASTQNPVSIPVDKRQARTRRLNQSITATRYTNPFANGMYVMSAHHTWFGRSIDEISQKIRIHHVVRVTPAGVRLLVDRLDAASGASADAPACGSPSSHPGAAPPPCDVRRRTVSPDTARRADASAADRPRSPRAGR